MIKISPTIVIGVGSTGRDIANSVRELLLEEFGVTGFPVVRFVNITTDKNNDSTTLTEEAFQEEYEKIRLIKVFLEQYDINRIKNGDKKEIAKEWVNKDFLEANADILIDGAGNIRQAGRLAFWDKFETIKLELINIKSSIKNQENIKKTKELLQTYLANKNELIDDNNELIDFSNINVFVVGTLAGGTCSGMFLDLGYLLRENIDNFFGIFTLHDINSATNDAENKRCANEYAALIELDYFMQYPNSYDYVLPGSYYVNNDAGPYKEVSLVTYSNINNSRAACANVYGEVKPTHLNQLIGLSIFLKIISGLNQGNAAINVNVARVDAGYSKDGKFVKIFKSFGTSAIWYPKNKIATNVALKFLIENISETLNQNRTNDNLESKEKSEAENIKKDITDSVKSYIKNLNSGIDSKIELQIENIFNSDIKGQSIEQLIKFKPENNPLINIFNSDGELFRSNRNKIDDINQYTKEKIKEIFSERITSSFQNFMQIHNNNITIINAVEYLSISRKLIELLKAELMGFNEKYESYNYTKSELPTLIKDYSIEEGRISTFLAGAKKRILKQHKERIKKAYYEDLIKYYDHTFLTFFVRLSLQQTIEDIESILKDILNPLKDRFEELKVYLNSKLEQVKDFNTAPAIQYVFKKENAEQDIKMFLDALKRERFKDFDGKDFIGEISDKTKDVKWIANNRLSYIQKYVIELINKNDKKDSFDILSNVTPVEINNKIELSRPLFEKANDFIEKAAQKPKFFGGGTNNSRKKIENIIAGQGIGFNQLPLNLDNLVFFYEEEPYIAIDELKVTKTLYSKYNDVNKEQKYYGAHIDKNPQKFSVNRKRNIEKLEEKLVYITKLFSDEMFDEIGNNSEHQKYYLYKYKNKFGHKFEFILVEDNQKDFLEKLSDNNEALNEFISKYDDNFRKISQNDLESKIKKYLEAFRIKKELTKGDQKYLSEKEKFDELYKQKIEANKGN